jgi:hypothetical protein
MKSLFSVLLIALFFSFLSKDVLAQSDSLPNRAQDDTGPRSKMDPWYQEQWGRHTSSTPDFREARVLKKGVLAPSPSDRTAFAGFLRMPNTGLIRLLPREVYDSETYHTKRRLNIRGGGAYYSFADLTHAYGFGNDIELDHNILSVGFAGADYGMLTNLGGRSLEEVTLIDPRTRFMAEYKPAKPEPDARFEFRRFQNGVTIDGVLYRSKLPVQVGTTYLLRSIVYRKSDVLVAFRVVRKDTDGSVIIAWKVLKEYRVPQLAGTN